MLLVLVLPSYKFYLVAKKVLTKFYAPHKIRHRLTHPFSRRYLIHLLIVIISLLTTAANLDAYEIHHQDIGQTSIISSLVAPEDYSVTFEEEGPVTATKRVTRYLGQSGVATEPRLTEEEQEILPPALSGSGALVKPIISPAEEQLRRRDQIVYYTVQIGDTISEIADKFGISVNTILWENNLSAYSLIRPSDKLTILPTSGLQHKVVRGETLNIIAKKYGVEPEKIIEFNKLASAADIRLGEKLMIPGGKKIISAPSYSIRSLTPQPTQQIASTGRFGWPTSCRRLSQYFRWRHTGIDIACGFGKPIYAADAGVVVKSQGGWNGGYGIMIVIDHGNGFKTLYGHNSKNYVAVGDQVSKGQLIAAMGSTGRSTGPHVHFEVWSNGVKRNPLSYTK
ncbi:MAG: hypothetical protein A2912_05995 [Candidatus Buchananbacteria bacterium RIFCSPLOWO2_01_FULL_40_23b]|uniref:LysM domain-containing protein n=1 Tax=Candidatus Buchananbacteria bacterium RIFCSPLOWO2_01_FULL_40_23b TaxID=1797544 RepID=A0A1G1YNX0_9BACT|nr:MAG: hypothetical protein A2912_05995 [Candidatus Buchananbacteria bacterium RIFCSPLOWO2_01_FULL_40_23b]